MDRIIGLSKRVSDAFAAVVANDFEAALMHICAAVENTAKAEKFPKSAKGYRAWLKQNMPIICGIGFGTALSGLAFASDSSGKGDIELETIIYKLVRCGLYHEGHLPDSFTLTDNVLTGPPVIAIPKSFVCGLVVAVVASPANAACATAPGYYVSVNGFRLYLNQSWGKRQEVLIALRGLKPVSPIP